MASKKRTAAKKSDELAADGVSCSDKRERKSAARDGKSANKTMAAASCKKKPSLTEDGQRKKKSNFSSCFRKFREDLGQAVSSVGDAIRPTVPSGEEVVKKQKPVERPGKLRTLWNGLGLLFHGVKYVVTKPHELLYRGVLRLIPSISLGQLNFLVIVLLVVFAWSIRSEIMSFLDTSIAIQEKTQQRVEALDEKMTKQQEMHGTFSNFSTVFQDALSRLEGMAGATINGVAERASEIAVGAADFVGKTYDSVTSWFRY